MQLTTVDRIAAARCNQAVGHVAQHHAVGAGEVELAQTIAAGGGAVLEDRAQLVFDPINPGASGDHCAVERIEGITQGVLRAALHVEGGADDVAVGIDITTQGC